MSSKNTVDREVQLVDKLEKIRRFFSEMDMGEQPTAAFKTLAEQVKGMFDADASAVYLYDQECNELFLIEAENIRKDLVGVKYKADQGLLGEVVKRKIALKVDDYSKWAGRSKVFEKENYKALLEAPIIWKDRLRGIIGLVRMGQSPPFSEIDSKLLSIVAIHTATLMSDGAGETT
ncbi:MAG: GAF domain-containing protein [Desulfobacteraceae bacterium]|nr:GAF domain-containing protein [Desulfobacteraceae bacterium]